MDPSITARDQLNGTRAARLRTRGLSQKAVGAAACGSVQQVQNQKDGQGPCRGLHLHAFAKLLGCRLSELAESRVNVAERGRKFANPNCSCSEPE